MVPELIPLLEFMDNRETKAIIAAGGIPFAVDMENVEPMELSVVKDQTTLILGDSMDSVESTYVTLIASISENEHIDVGMIDNASTRFGAFKDNMDIYAKDNADMDIFVERLQSLYETREDAFREVQIVTKGHATVTDFLKEIRPMIILVTDVLFVIDTMSLATQTTLAKLIETGARMGIYFIVGAAHGSIDRLYDDITTVLKKQKVGVLIGRIADQNILEVLNRSYKEKSLEPYEAYYIKHGNAEKIKIVAPF